MTAHFMIGYAYVCNALQLAGDALLISPNRRRRMAAQSLCRKNAGFDDGSA
jgi:hypothetical protein